jgi:tape measure domain-containing protein
VEGGDLGMSTIDERVVNMKMNSGQFLSGVKGVIDALANLKKGLDLKSSAKGLSDLDRAGKNFNLDGMANAIQGVSGKFLSLATIGITALSNLTNKAIAAGSQIAKALTVDPIKAGLAEYETNLNSIQTILANTQASGATLNDVNSALQELNTYSDKTIYNFSEMARNIGTFTAAGVGLKESTSAIKGIANLAALSGSNSQQAASAMYQLSQAIAAGRVSLMDWNSVVNAGMGGTTFQRALAQTAVAMGTLPKSAVKLSGAMKNVTVEGKSFRDSISGDNGPSWLTSDVLTKTLAQFTGDMSDAQLAAQGFSQEQIKAIQATAKTAQAAATEVKTLSQVLDVAKETAGSGWAQTWQIVFGDFAEAKSTFTQMSNTVNGFINASANARNSMLKEWDKLGGRTAAIDAIKNAFDALVSVLKPIKDAFREIFPATTGKQLYQLTTAIRDFMKSLKLSAADGENLKSTFKGVFAVFDIGWTIIKKVIGVFKDVFSAVFSGSGAFLSVTASIGDFLVKLDQSIKSGEGLTSFFDGLSRVLVTILTNVKQVAGAIGSFFKSFATGDGATKSFSTFIESVQAHLHPLAVLLDAMSKIWSRLGDVMSRVWQMMGPLGEAIGKALSGIGDSIAKALNNGDWSTVLDTLNTGLFAVLTLAIKKFLSNGKIFSIEAGGGGGGFLSGIKEAFGGLTDTLSAMQANLKAGTLIKIAGAVGILAASVVALSMIDSAALTKSLGAISVMFLQLGVAMAAIQKVGSFGGALRLAPVAAGLILLSGAILILSAAVKNLSGMNWSELAKGLSSVMALLIGISGAVKLMQGAGKGMISAGAGMLAIAVALNILVLAVKQFATMKWSEIGKGLAAVAGSLLVIAGAMQLMPATLPLTAVGLVAVGAALVIIGAALKIMASMSWEEIGKGLTTLAGSLIIIAAATTAMIAALPGAAALLVVSASLVVLGAALKIMGGLSWKEVAVALVTLAGSLTIIAVAVTAMIAALPGAAALAIVAASLALLGPVLIGLGSMSWAEIGKGLLMLAGVLPVIGIAGAVLTPVIPTLLGLGAAIALIGIGTLAAGAGLLAFSVGLTALSAAGVASAAAITAVGSAIINLIPAAMAALARGIVAFAGVISGAGPQMTQAMTTLIMSLLNAINKVAPKIISTLANLILKLLTTLAKYVPQFVTAGLRLITGVLQGIANNVGKMVTAATNIVVNFLNGISRNIPRVIQAAVNLILAFVNGLANAIRSNQGRVDAAMQNLASAAISAFGHAITNVSSLGTNIVAGIALGISNGIGVVVSAARNLAHSALNAAKAALGIHSPSREFEKLGKFTNEGYAKGLVGSKASVQAATKQMLDLVKQAHQAAWDDMKKASADVSKYKDQLIKDNHDIAKAEAALDKARKSGKGVDDAKFRLSQLIKERDKDTASLKAAQKALAQATSEDKKAVAVQKMLTENFKHQNEVLKRLGAEHDKIAKKLDAANKKLADAKKIRDDFKASTIDQYDSMDSIDANTNLDDYMANLKDEVEKTNRLNIVLSELAKKGLSDKVYKQIVEQGTAALPFAEQLLAGGQADIDEINSLGAQLDTAAGKLGKAASTELYQAAVDSAAGLVKGLETQQKNIEKQMDKIADAMVASIKKKLGIHSPSRVFAGIGGFSALGLAKGLKASSKVVENASSTMGDRAVNALKESMKKAKDLAIDEADFNPAIRPVLDLTAVQKASGKLEGMLRPKPLSIQASTDRATSLAVDEVSKRDLISLRDELHAERAQAITYIQHNNSPKSLSSAEIYRQTKNQLSVAKGALPK